jgi:DNA repair protein RadC
MKEKCAYSIKTTRVMEPDFPYKGEKLDCTANLVRFAKSLQDADVEKFLGLHLDSQNVLICVQVIPGTVNMAIVFPREVLRHSLLVNASALIMVHNHPSGSLTPSDGDIRLTKALVEGAKLLEILIHDHLIIGGLTGNWFSFREEGIMPI